MLVRAPTEIAASPASKSLLYQMLGPSAARRRPFTLAVPAMNTEACTCEVAAMALRASVTDCVPCACAILARRSATSPAASARTGLAGLPA